MPNAAKERERSRRRRRDAKIEKLEAQIEELTAKPVLFDLDDVDLTDPAQALADWSAACLVVPSGHPNAGDSLVLPDYGVSFLRDALVAKESLMSIGRKNAKSAIVSVYLLGRLVGPLRTPGYRAGVCSVNREKAAELYRQAEAIAAASNLEGLTFRRAPFRIIGPDGEVDILAAERTAGHSSGYDDAILDELGLLEERHRELVNGLRSSVSARNGRFIALSIQGASPFTEELLERRHDPGVAVHHYTAPEGCALDDREGWLAANPGLGTVKSWDYMQQAASRAIAVPADSNAFRAHELNQRTDPNSEVVIPLADYLKCVVSALPAREGSAWVGLDVGGASAFCGAAVYWPASGRCEVFAGVGGIPDLLTRSRGDGVGDLYVRMHNRGELWVYPNHRETPLQDFVSDLNQRLHDVVVGGLVGDEYRGARLRDALEAAELQEWSSRLSFRPVRWKTSTDDVVAFQTQIITQGISFVENVLMPAAIRDSKLEHDKQGGLRPVKSREHGRIDALTAVILAVGIGERNRTDPDAGSGVFGSMSA